MMLQDILTVEIFHRTAPNRDQEWTEGGGFNSTGEIVRRLSNGVWEVFDSETQSWMVIIRERVIVALEKERRIAKRMGLS